MRPPRSAAATKAREELEEGWRKAGTTEKSVKSEWRFVPGMAI
ncbi:MAG TPA: hypothetical protein VNH19_20495 [Candidatus Limnocylindrales bacterium]|nr:hypothetical protein [Candidatus Limnocylindrales bacterium]